MAAQVSGDLTVGSKAAIVAELASAPKCSRERFKWWMPVKKSGC